MKISLSIFPFCPFCWQNEQNETVKSANWQTEQNEIVKLANWQNEQKDFFIIIIQFYVPFKVLFTHIETNQSE